MQMTYIDYKSLLVRVTKLERQNRVWKIAGLVLLLATLYSLTTKVAAQQFVPNAPRPSGDRLLPAPPPTTLEARTFILRDSAGVMRGKMTVDGDRHPVLEFYDWDGNLEWSTDNHAIPAK
ncbi:MAG: hypothetical protein WA211_03540 [Candidatus Acidiferrales bacterium]